jgi:uncharacterized protein (TIGR00251 family)
MERPDRAEIVVRVIPRSKNTEITGERDGALVVRVAAPPVEGAANEALVDFFSSRVPRRAIRIVSGEHGRLKRIAIEGFTPTQLRDLLKV